MIYYVYLDPQIISTALAKGNLGVQALTGILHALSQNCFLAEFKNYSYTQEEIGEQLKNIVGDFDTKALKVVLKRFAKERLFIECLTYDYSGISEVEMVQNNCDEALLDILILADTAKIQANIPVEVSTLETYHNSYFEPQRSKVASRGITLVGASLNENDFLENYLKKALKYARWIEIFDYQCGEKYKANYDYTLRKFLRWLESVNGEDLTITIHCGFPDENQSSICQENELEGLSVDEIEPLKKERLNQVISVHCKKSEIRVTCYDSKFAHDRFILTDQIAFEIGIGMDFLNHQGENKGKIRDISIGLKDAKEVRNLING